METTEVRLNGRIIPLVIRRHARARRISLRLSPARDSVMMTLPRRSTIEAGMRFFHAKAKWVLASIEAPAGTTLCDGATFPLLGQDCLIRHVPGRGIAQLITQNAQLSLLVRGDPAFTSRRVRDFLKKYLQALCLEHAQAMACAIAKKVRAVNVRDTRSRWGSCSAKGNLSFNWRLVFAPIEILDYLIAHEVAHLAEMNHGPRFWKVVAALCPDYMEARKWLKKEGYRLHGYD